jgi:hypothetical protein
LLIATTLVLTTATGLAAQPFELPVRHKRFLGGTPGTLVFAGDQVEFRARDEARARRWIYEDLKQIRVLSPTRIALATYEDRGLLRLGADRTLTFDTTDGAVVTEALVAFLLDRVARPLLTTVMPPLPASPLGRVPVKHQRRRGTEGSLVLYEQGLAYLTEDEKTARFWRFQDLASVLALDPYRLQVTAYEGGSGETRPFVFELKTELAPGVYEQLWQHVNRPLPFRAADEPSRGVASPPITGPHDLHRDTRRRDPEPRGPDCAGGW